MIIAIHQPNLFPRLKTLQKLAFADVWIVLDDVQYCQREFQNRALIVPLAGEKYWCTVPVSLPQGRSTKIKDVIFEKDNALKIVSDMLKYSFKGDTVNKRIYYAIMESLQSCKGGFSDFVVASVIALLKLSGVQPFVIKSSELNDATIGKNEKLISLCKKVGGDTYISDSGGAHYIKETLFRDNNINLLWHIWEKPEVPSIKSMDMYIRDGAGINILGRSQQDYIDLVMQCKVTKVKKYAEGK